MDLMSAVKPGGMAWSQLTGLSFYKYSTAVPLARPPVKAVPHEAKWNPRAEPKLITPSIT